MSFAFDGSLSNVLPTSADSKRALTPSKLFTRPITPQRTSSAPRSNSNNRDTRTNDITLDPHVDRRSRSGAISTRKLRRWENKNLFGVENFSKSKEERILESLNNSELGSENVPFEITWRSTLSRLLKPENQLILNDFLTCRDVFTTGTYKSQNARKGRSAHRSDWSDAEDSWLKIEKRIRAAISRSFATSDVIEDFLAQLEQVILHFIHTKQALGFDKLSDELKKELAQPISVDRSGNLVIPLHESAFRRLLVHGVAQFYGLQSNSVKGKNDQFKSCLIKLPKLSTSTSAKPNKDDSPVPLASPATSPTTTAKVPVASSGLPATATRCLSLVRFLTLVREQQHAQAQAQHLAPDADADADGSEVTATAAGEVASSSGSSSSSSRAAGVVHVMTALERRLASLTVQDASALVSAAQQALGLSVSSSVGAGADGAVLQESEPGSVGSDSPVVISALDLASGSVDLSLRGGGSSREGLGDHVLLSTPALDAKCAEDHSPLLSMLRSSSEEYVLL